MKDCFQVLNIHIKLWVFLKRQWNRITSVFISDYSVNKCIICSEYSVNSGVVDKECCVLLRWSRSTFLVCVVPK